jgi:hypothetical protein
MSAQREFHECVAFADWLDLMRLKYSHIPNETRTPHVGVLVKNRRMGVRKGVPDYIIVGRGKVLFVEMKAKGGKARPEQREWIDAINAVGGPVRAEICYGAIEAIEFVKKSLT